MGSISSADSRFIIMPARIKFHICYNLSLPSENIDTNIDQKYQLIASDWALDFDCLGMLLTKRRIFSTIGYPYSTPSKGKFSEKLEISQKMGFTMGLRM